MHNANFWASASSVSPLSPISNAAVRTPFLLLPVRPLVKSSSPFPLSFQLNSKVSQLVRDDNCHRIRLGTWATCQHRALDSVLLPEDPAGAIRSTLIDLRDILIARCGTIWEDWREASNLLVVQNALDLSSTTRAARLRGKGRYCAVRVGRHPRVYLT